MANMVGKNELALQSSKLMENIMRDVVTVESLYVK